MDYGKILETSGVTDEELDSLTDAERKVLIDMMNELIDTGSSNTLKSLWYEDYEEVPVDIETFITDEDYLGASIGGSLYPFWMDVLKKLFAPNAKYFECILSGAIGIGKTTVSDIGIAYMLHKLLCLKNPQEHYGLTKSSIMTINFFNVTKDLSYGVSYSKLQSMLIDSPWFRDHGSVIGRNNQAYVPGKNIQINVGSQLSHALGQDVFCLYGDTEICTSNGVFKVEDLEGEEVQVYQVDDNGSLTLSDPCEVLLTSYTTELMEIELEDGCILKCTPNHLLRLTDGSYKRACELTIEDEIMEGGMYES